jgi:hypothetical protein
MVASRADAARTHSLHRPFDDPNLPGEIQMTIAKLVEAEIPD